MESQGLVVVVKQNDAYLLVSNGANKFSSGNALSRGTARPNEPTLQAGQRIVLEQFGTLVAQHCVQYVGSVLHANTWWPVLFVQLPQDARVLAPGVKVCRTDDVQQMLAEAKLVDTLSLAALAVVLSKANALSLLTWDPQ